MQEDSPAGLALRRYESAKNNPTYSAVDSSITSVCEKLNFDESLRKRIRETWYAVRGPHGLTNASVERSLAPYIGLGCVYWVIRAEGMQILPARLARLAGVKKDVVLRASLKVETVLGFPVSAPQLDQLARSEVQSSTGKTISRALEKIRRRNRLQAEEAELLGNFLLQRKLAEEESMEAVAAVSGFLFLAKFEAKRRHFDLKRFCKEYSFAYNSSLLDLREKVTRVLTVFSKKFCDASDSLEYVITNFRDFSRFMASYDETEFAAELNKT